MTTFSSSPNQWLTGFIADLPTPFDECGRVDWAAFERLCECQIRSNATAIVVGETMGESSTLTPYEHEAVVRTAVNVSAGRIAVIAGAGSNSTSQAIALTSHAERAGADAILSVVPYYNKPLQTGIRSHFLAIANSTGLPIVLHDAPARTARELTDETIVSLAQSRQFIGLKDAGNIGRLLHLRSSVPAGFRLLTADDATAVGYFLSGGDGCISVAANIAPDLCGLIYERTRVGDSSQANHLALGLANLAAALTIDATPAPVKYALAMLGVMMPTVRLPVVEPDEPTKIAVAKILAETIGQNAFGPGRMPTTHGAASSARMSN